MRVVLFVLVVALCFMQDLAVALHHDGCDVFEPWMITRQVCHHRFTRISIVNWHTYQTPAADFVSADDPADDPAVNAAKASLFKNGLNRGIRSMMGLY